MAILCRPTIQLTSRDKLEQAGCQPVRKSHCHGLILWENVACSMFTAVPQRIKIWPMPSSYFDEHLAQNDYYAAGEIRPGQWIGAGAERLGLKNVVTREQFHALCENQNPETMAND
jgi:hypothetical protein